ncbi:hypothetical protein LX32DRAFT_641089 [Colletotrichum zoysiae]|uniref:Uncharacterized protein n=1 Tax=Colletotrichum zoysiae TaxID=1216348 RepID=A0AAD9LZZ2_9PEZI|nr:hypothetical protein LX32DRAFT_641089 [Colletotrichum zoysiae]
MSWCAGLGSGDAAVMFTGGRRSSLNVWAMWTCECVSNMSNCSPEHWGLPRPG